MGTLSTKTLMPRDQSSTASETTQLRFSQKEGWSHRLSLAATRRSPREAKSSSQDGSRTLKRSPSAKAGTHCHNNNNFYFFEKKYSKLGLQQQQQNVHFLFLKKRKVST